MRFWINQIVLFLIITLLLIGCKHEDEAKQLTNDDTITASLSERIQNIDINDASYDSIIEILGEPDAYYVDGEPYTEEGLPGVFLMKYNDGVDIEIDNSVLKKLIITSTDVTYDGFLYLGLNSREAKKYLKYNNSPDRFPYSRDKSVFAWEISNSDYLEIRSVDSWNSGDPLLGYSKSGEYGIWVTFDKKAWKVKEIEYVNIDEVNSRLEASKLFEIKGWEEHSSEEFSAVEIDGVMYEFEEDDSLVGEWHFRDHVFDLKDYDPENQATLQRFTNLTIKENGVIEKSYYNWTKDYLISSKKNQKIHKYEILNIEGIEHLLVFLGDSTDNNFYIFEKYTD